MSTQVTNLPEAFLDKLPKIFSNNLIPTISESFTGQNTLSFRVNTLKISIVNCIKLLKDLGFEIAPVSWNKNAFIIKNKSTTDLTETDIYKNGYVYIQNLSSMIPALILDPKPNEEILDLTAAPGSKTTQIATLMENTGYILANDISRSRNFKLLNNLKINGVTNTKVITSAAQTLWQKYPEYFDKVLVDAPCSMEGRFKINDPKSYQDWSAKKVKILGKRNEYILRSAVSAAKPGGIIVYSTCTLSPEENEMVIDWILKTEKDAIKIEDIELKDIPFVQGLTNWNDKDLNPQIKKTVRVVPSSNFEGFYVAKIRKLKSTVKLV